MRNLTTTLIYPKIPTYSWTSALIPNWTWSCSRLLRFTQISNLWLIPLHGFQYVTKSNNLIDCCWLQSSSLHRRWRSGRTWLQNPKSISIRVCKKVLFYNLKTYFIYFTVSFYNSSNILVSIFPYNLLK